MAQQLSKQQQREIKNIATVSHFLANKPYDLSQLPRTCPSYFADFQRLNNIANIGIVNKQGDLLCATNGKIDHINIADRGYFKNAMTHNSAAIGYFQHDRSWQAPSINFAVAIIDNSDQVIGALVSVIALEQWNVALNNLMLPSGARVVITDSKQLILANYPNDSTRWGRRLDDTDITYTQQPLTPFKSSSGSQQIFYHETIYRDQQHNNLAIYIALPIAGIMAELDANFAKFIGLFLLALGAFALLAKKLLKQSIFNPLKHLTQAIERLANGEMPNNSEQPASQELNHLYQRFKNMAHTRLQAEAKLQLKHDELKSLLNALPDDYLKINLQGDILNMSDSFKHLPPTAPHFHSQLSLSGLLGEHNAHQLLTHLYNKDEGFPLELTLSDNQQDKHLEAHINALSCQQQCVILLRDISKRKANEAALHLAALVYENSSEAMIVTDANGIIYDVNPAFTKATLFTKQEVLGKTTQILSSGQHDSAFYQAMWTELSNSGRWQGEITNRRKNGELYDEWLTIDTIYDAQRVATRRIAIFTDLTETKRNRELIWKQSRFDMLTDLPNRLQLRERLNECLQQPHNDSQQLVIMLLDIDHFKEVNDSLGHSFGDELLKIVAQRIAQQAYNAELVARIGSDEFVIVFHCADNIAQLKQQANTLLRALSAVIVINDEKLFMSASIGIACAPSDANNTEQLLKAADQAMHKAKLNGRNGYEFFSPDMEQKIQARRLLLKDLRDALEKQQFELFYQPIVALNDLHIHKAEGLIRWQHPINGLISPAEFIPLAEETRLINPIGQFVFEQALNTLNDIKQQLNLTLQISINVSPIQLSEKQSSLDLWAEQLANAQLPASAIVAEITEGLMVNPEALTQQRLKALVKSGMQLALDDFGTGYSSLAYLQAMDTHYLKIDKRFVDNIQPNSRELALCEAIIVMAHQLGLQVIAEGVETELQRQLLLEAGCDYGQGYLFAKPMPKEDFLALLKHNTSLT